MQPRYLSQNQGLPSNCCSPCSRSSSPDAGRKTPAQGTSHHHLANHSHRTEAARPRTRAARSRRARAPRRPRAERTSHSIAAEGRQRGPQRIFIIILMFNLVPLTSVVLRYIDALVSSLVSAAQVKWGLNAATTSSSSCCAPSCCAHVRVDGSGQVCSWGLDALLTTSPRHALTSEGRLVRMLGPSESAIVPS
jgi:hypothetical protein